LGSLNIERTDSRMVSKRKKYKLKNINLNLD
jgi:hypothetical protein